MQQYQSHQQQQQLQQQQLAIQPATPSPSAQCHVTDSAEAVDQQCVCDDMAEGDYGMPQLPVDDLLAAQRNVWCIPVPSLDVHSLIASRCPLMPQQHADERQLAQVVQQSLSLLNEDPAKQAAATMDSEVWVKHIISFMPDPDDFQAGTLHTRVAAFEAHWSRHANKPTIRLLLHVLREGYKLHLKHPYAPCQQAHPRFANKEREVRALLSHVLPSGSEVQRVMRAPQPAILHFPNHQSVNGHVAFVQGEAASCICSADAPEAASILVLPLGVAVNRHGKERLILDARYLNWWDEYHTVVYQQLRHVLRYIRHRWRMVKMDLKAGYHHVLMAPCHRHLLGFEFQGSIYVYNALPFGLSSACWLFNTLMGAVYMPLEAMGVPLTYLLDDLFMAADFLPRVRWHLWVVVRIMVALGFVFGIPKCVLDGLLRLIFLGMGVDTDKQQFYIPEDKLAYFEQQLTELAQAMQLTPRQVAAVLGMIVSFRPALPLGNLYTRTLHTCMTGVQQWDAVFQSQRHLCDELRWLSANLRTLHGAFFWPQPQGLVLVGDASERQYAAFTPNGELAAPIIVPMSEQELQQLHAGHLSSTLREARTLRVALPEVLRSCHLSMQGKTVVYYTDSQAAQQCFSSIIGTDAVFQEVKACYEALLPLQARLEVRWHPRETFDAQHADRLSKVVDTADYMLQHTAYQGLLHRVAISAPVVDLFATAHNSQTHRFYSWWLSPGVERVDAMLQPWHQFTVRAPAYAFPPPELLPHVVRKMLLEKPAVLLVVWNWSIPGLGAAWHELPKRLQVALPPAQSVLRPGPMFPAQSSLPHGMLQAFWISFD